MGAVSQNELDGIAMEPTWNALDPVRALHESMTKFCLEELPRDAKWSAAGMTMANKLCTEFRCEIWPHRVPTRWELILADRAGRLEEKIKEINEAFARGE